jgi:diguanylate cyclase (GGDEF)-like protein
MELHGDLRLGREQSGAAVGSVGRRIRPLPWFARSAVVLVSIWVAGLVAMGAVIRFEQRVDESRRAQIVIEHMRTQEGDVLALAFAAAITKAAAVPTKERLARMDAVKSPLNRSLETLAGLGGSEAPNRIRALKTVDFALMDRLSLLVSQGRSGKAALELGASQQPTGIRARLAAEFDSADVAYGDAAARSRVVAVIGTCVAIVLLLLAFSVVFQISVRARRRSQLEATTDVLTGLGNRRKLFADVQGRLDALEGKQVVALGMFDLDGFKTYNDTFGHPAGDALLARLGQRLSQTVGSRGSVYRIGGDEFVVISDDDDGESLLDDARRALTETGDGFTIGASVGSTRILPGITLEQALHVADQRLYTDKRSRHTVVRSEIKDVLMQVLAEQDRTLITHSGHVADLVESTARRLGLSREDIELTKLGAELHDVGKAAIPASILDKPGPLEWQERLFMQRHSEIGERIVAAAPTLAAIAPIVRSIHERVDGAGYPDGLSLENIPIHSRIIAVVDAFDAMTSERPYRVATSTSEALAELHRHAGTQFDPIVVEAFALALSERIVTAEAA